MMLMRPPVSAPALALRAPGQMEYKSHTHLVHHFLLIFVTPCSQVCSVSVHPACSGESRVLSQPTFSRFSLPSASAGALLPKKAAKVFCGRNVHALVSLSSAHGGSGRGAMAASSSSSVTQAWSEACGGVYTIPG